MKRLLVVLFGVGALWVGLQFHDTTATDPLDVFMVVEIAGVMLFASLVMLIFTRTWSSRGIGVFLTTTGTGLLYAAVQWSGTRAVALMAGSSITLADGSIVTVPDGARLPGIYPEWYIDIIRSCYIVGGPLFLVGLIVWVWTRIGRHQPAPSDPLAAQS